MQENRTFDNLFNGFPGADTVQTGMYKGVAVPLLPTSLVSGGSLDNSHPNWWRQWNGGAMDNFGSNTNLLAYSYINPSDVKPYWTLATNFTLGDRMFQSNSGPSFAAHQYMIAGQSGGTSANPSGNVWGCGAAADARVSLVGPNGTNLPGVFPCFDYQTMGDLLDAKGITWRYYAPSPQSDANFLISAYQAIRHIFFGPDWNKNVISPETNVFADVEAGQLAQVTWIIPAWNNSDHPGAPAQGPDWVASIVNAIGKSKFWNSTAIFISDRKSVV
jgi:phospholipase C